MTSHITTWGEREPDLPDGGTYVVGGEPKRIPARRSLSGYFVTDTQCLLCGAKPGWPCRQLNGAFRGPHEVRMAPPERSPKRDALEPPRMSAEELITEHTGRTEYGTKGSDSWLS